jgi:hypothetical protein
MLGLPMCAKTLNTGYLCSNRSHPYEHVYGSAEEGSDISVGLLSADPNQSAQVIAIDGRANGYLLQ